MLGSLGSRVFMISSAFLAEIFFNTRSTLSEAEAFAKRSMMVVAVKSAAAKNAGRHYQPVALQVL